MFVSYLPIEFDCLTCQAIGQRSQSERGGIMRSYRKLIKCIVNPSSRAEHAFEFELMTKFDQRDVQNALSLCVEVHNLTITKTFWLKSHQRSGAAPGCLLRGANISLLLREPKIFAPDFKKMSAPPPPPVAPPLPAVEWQNMSWMSTDTGMLTRISERNIWRTNNTVILIYVIPCLM